MKYNSFLEMAGNTPHVRFVCPEPPRASLYIKMEGYNPTGSIKDRAGLNLIQDKIDTGILQKGMTLLDASSGNMACAIAYYGCMLGYATTVVVGSKLTEDKLRFIEYMGAEVIRCGDFTIQGNHHCRELVAAAGPSHYCFLDQLHNWANPRAHFETTGPEIFADFPNLSLVVGSLGSGGSLLGTGQFLKGALPHVKVVAVEAASGTKIPGTGGFDDGDYVTPFIEKGIETKIFDHFIKVTEDDAVRRTAQLKEQGFFCGLQTGGVLHAALEAIDKLRPDGDVVILSGDSGWKNLDKLARL